MKQSDTAILYCHCAYKDIIPEETRAAALTAISGLAADCFTVADLCELIAGRDALPQQLAQYDRILILACYPRAIQWLFEQAGTKLDMGRVSIINMRTAAVDEVVDALRQFAAGRFSGDTAPELQNDAADGGSSAAAPAEKNPLRSTLEQKGEWIPWFPVIDYDKCTHCKQCLSFCPFGVYSLDDEDKVRVTSPRNCKNNCPACARICPQLAIIFPKVIDRPINGDEVKPGDRLNAQKALEEQKRELAAKSIHDVLAQRKLRALQKRMAERFEKS